jgi:hypothetical protein
VIRQSLVRTPHPFRDGRSAGLCRPRFPFFSIQLSKNGLHETRGRRPVVWSGPPECRSRGSLGFHEGELFSRQRRRRPRCGGYIVGHPFRCQHRSRKFFGIFCGRPGKPGIPPACRKVNGLGWWRRPHWGRIGASCVRPRPGSGWRRKLPVGLPVELYTRSGQKRRRFVDLGTRERQSSLRKQRAGEEGKVAFVAWTISKQP